MRVAPIGQLRLGSKFRVNSFAEPRFRFEQETDRNTEIRKRDSGHINRERFWGWNVSLALGLFEIHGTVTLESTRNLHSPEESAP